MYPKVEVDLQELHKLGGLHATYDEVAAWFQIAPRTVRNRMVSNDQYDFQGRRLTFREIFDEGKAKGNVSLRRKQMELALSGDRVMLIWLGKQILGQRDAVETRLADPDGSPFTIRIVRVVTENGQVIREEEGPTVSQVNGSARQIPA